MGGTFKEGRVDGSRRMAKEFPPWLLPRSPAPAEALLITAGVSAKAWFRRASAFEQMRCRAQRGGLPILFLKTFLGSSYLF